MNTKWEAQNQHIFASVASHVHSVVKKSDNLKNLTDCDIWHRWCHSLPLFFFLPLFASRYLQNFSISSYVAVPRAMTSIIFHFVSLLYQKFTHHSSFSGFATVLYFYMVGSSSYRWCFTRSADRANSRLGFCIMRCYPFLHWFWKYIDHR